MSTVTRRAVPSPGSRIRLILLIAMAFVAAWFSLRYALLGMMARDYPMLGLALKPSSPISASIIAVNRVGRDGVADDRTREFIDFAARRSPLLAEPFIAAGLDASARDRSKQAEQLFVQARTRDPRSVIARYWLLDFYMRSGDFANGVDEAQPLIRLQPAVTPAVTSMLTALLDVPQARDVVLQRLAANPVWRPEFLRQVAASSRLRERFGALLLTDRNEAPAALRDRERLLADLLARGDVDEAWASWLATLPADGRGKAKRGSVYDGNFAGLPGGPPFNWRLAGQDAIAGEIAPSGGDTALQVSISARKDTVIAEQTVLAASGPHILRFVAQGFDDQPSAAVLEARIRCGGGRKAIAAMQTDILEAEPTVFTMKVNIPADCRAVQVRFLARPGEVPGGLYALISSVTLTPRG